jgi:dienelactone hydrolase
VHAVARRLGFALVLLALLAAPRIARLLVAHLLALDLLAPGWAPTFGQPVRTEVTMSGSQADLYRPPGPARGGLLLVHGLSRFGRSHPAFQRAAQSLARAGFVVLAPDFDELRAFHLSESDVAAVSRAVTRLAELAPPPLGILGVSFGAGPALLAAADPSIRDKVDLVGSLGGYYDLVHVVGFITTGWFEDNGIFAQTRQQEYNRWKLLAALTPYVTDQAERSRLQRIADLKLADPRMAVQSEVSRLGPEGRQLFALVENRERDRVSRLLAGLGPSARTAFQHLSPAASIGRVRARLLIAHGRADDSIPFTESLKLARSAPNAGGVVIFDGLRHAFPSEQEWLARFSQLKDLERLVWLLDELLGMRPRT